MNELKIATGHSRFEKKWKNITISWDDLVKRVQTTTTTQETLTEYLKMSKQKQDEIKDVGGFVGGWLKNGQRRNGSVEFRSVLTLDADYAHEDLWLEYTLMHNWKCAVYSTHKHTKEKPRLRFIFPLTRSVSPEEYEALGRWVAKEIGIDYFDDTTYQPARLMYWPSTSRGNEFFKDESEGKWIDPDVILANYGENEGWKDVSKWPMSSRETEIRQTLSKKQDDPLQKQGVIGAFCRTYSIQEVIESFLSDIYAPTGHDNRFTYLGGSTSGGLVIYDDKFAYSNHSTDPASGQLCNAFDLVRIHKFGHLDDDAKENTPANRLPSFTTMSDFCKSDENVKVTLFADRQQEAVSDFYDIETDDPQEESDWIKNLKFKKNGDLEPLIGNAYLIIKHDENLKNVGKHNEFTHGDEVVGKLPWSNKKVKREWTDADDAGLRMYLETNYGMVGKDKIYDGITNVFNERTYHPVRDYLDSLEWDGVERLDTLLVDYLGAEDNKLTRAMTRKLFTAAVARIYQPGIKFDTMLMLSGDQGIGKSTFVAKMSKGWYTDRISDIRSKDSKDELEGVWFVEMAELVALTKADIESVKGFISSPSDKYRKSYARRKGVYPRQCVFIGTTNSVEVLRDKTGNRRFWMVHTTKNAKFNVWDDLTDEVIEQLHAEAKHYYQNNESIYLDAELDALAEERRELYQEVDVWEEKIRNYLEIPIPEDFNEWAVWERKYYIHRESDFASRQHSGIKRDRTCPQQIWDECFGYIGRDLTRPDTKRINEILRNMPDWEETNTIRIEPSYGRVRGFKRKEYDFI